ncbi:MULTISPECIES: DUF7310 family coiled-coil domain-containing protein [Haloarcula]|uniref:DUF7310 family coiled-coil domain-containing protein n=1 Tax=Haloarcula TaxID=2237 RepID=UPI0023ED4C7E|nr:hypothetical protein [Halomicroarcula sp. XH51]
MTDLETLAERVRTVERAVTDGESEFPDATALADLETRIEALEDRVADIDDRTTELEAATQALRGYVGNVRSVNEDVEQRADAALAATDRLERRLDEELPGRGRTAPVGDGTPTGQGGPDETVAGQNGVEDTLTGQRGPDSVDQRCDAADEIRPPDGRPAHAQDSTEFDSAPAGSGGGHDTDDLTSLTEGASDRDPDAADEPGVLARIRAYL